MITSLITVIIRCTSCVGTIERSLSRRNGIKSVRVALLSSMADVEHASSIQPTDIIQWISEAGYGAQPYVQQSGAEVLLRPSDPVYQDVSAVDYVKGLNGVLTAEYVPRR